MFHRRWRTSNGIHPSRFLLEPLEPRCLLDAADVSTDGTMPITFPATIVDHFPKRLESKLYPFIAEEGALYRFQVDSGSVEIDLSIEDPSGSPYWFNARHGSNQILWRAPRDGLFQL